MTKRRASSSTSGHFCLTGVAPALWWVGTGELGSSTNYSALIIMRRQARYGTSHFTLNVETHGEYHCNDRVVIVMTLQGNVATVSVALTRGVPDVVFSTGSESG